MTQLAIK